MEYKKTEQRQKTTFAIAVTVGVILFGVALSYLLGSSLISDSSAANPTKPPVQTLTPSESELVIKDEALVRAIQKQLGINEPLTKEHMYELEVLDYTDETITDLSGLEHAISLVELRLKVDITTIYPLTFLNLSKLTFVSDVSMQPLLDEMDELQHVTYLDLSNCGITTLGYISEMPSLQTLILDNNRAVGLSYLNNMPFLTTVSLKNNNIKNIAVLENNHTIQTLYLDNNLITDISVLKKIPSLETCTYENNPIKQPSDDEAD